MDSTNSTQNTTNDDQNQTDKNGFDFANDMLTKDILELMGAENMTPEEKANIYNKMMHTVQNRVLARVLDDLSDSEYEELKKILDIGDTDGFEKFATEIQLDLAKIYAEEALLYKIEMVNLINSSNDQSNKEE